MEVIPPQDPEMPEFTWKLLQGNKASEGFAHQVNIMHLSVAKR